MPVIPILGECACSVESDACDQEAYTNFCILLLSFLVPLLILVHVLCSCCSSRLLSFLSCSRSRSCCVLDLVLSCSSFALLIALVLDLVSGSTCCLFLALVSRSLFLVLPFRISLSLSFLALVSSSLFLVLLFCLSLLVSFLALVSHSLFLVLPFRFSLSLSFLALFSRSLFSLALLLGSPYLFFPLAFVSCSRSFALFDRSRFCFLLSFICFHFSVSFLASACASSVAFASRFYCFALIILLLSLCSRFLFLIAFVCSCTCWSCSHSFVLVLFFLSRVCRPQTCYNFELFAQLWNSSDFNPIAPPSQCHSVFVSEIDCSYAAVLGLAAATAAKNANLFTSMRCKLLTILKIGKQAARTMVVWTENRMENTMNWKSLMRMDVWAESRMEEMMMNNKRFKRL